MTERQIAFECLWCGRPHTPRNPDDLESYARLCPECVGRAGDNPFLRFRLKRALADRASGTAPTATRIPGGGGAEASGAASTPSPNEQDGVPANAQQDVSTPDLEAEMRAYYAARAPEYDDFYLRRGRYEHGPVHDMAWQMELDQVTRWLDDLPLHGEIVELAAGTGWWSPLLAQKGHLTISDANRQPLQIAMQRLEAHRLRVGVVLRDAWEPPDRSVDALFVGFWLSHVPRPRLAEFLAIARQWLAPGGRFAFVDSRADSHGGAALQGQPDFSTDIQVRPLADGRTFRVIKVYYEPDELRDALAAAGFDLIDMRTSGRFFLFGSAVAL